MLIRRFLLFGRIFIAVTLYYSPHRREYAALSLTVKIRSLYGKQAPDFLFCWRFIYFLCYNKNVMTKCAVHLNAHYSNKEMMERA